MTVTARGRGLLVAAVLLWVAARSFGIPQLQVAAAGAALLVLMSVVWARLRRLRVTADRTLTPARTRWGGEVEIRLELQATSRLAPVTLHEQVPAGVTGPPDVALGALRRGARVTVARRIAVPRRGRHQIGPTTVRLDDPFGIVTRTRRIAAPSELIVHPPVRSLPAGLPLGGGSGQVSDGGRQASRSGDDLADIREYVRGDDLRTVHWPSTARRGALMVRNNEQGSAPSAVLVFDRRADRHRGRTTDGSFETTVALVASVGAHLTGRGRSVVMLSDPAAAPVHARPWEHHLDALAGVGTGTVDLPGVFRQITEGMAGNGTLIAVVTTPTAAELRDLVRAGHRFAVRVLLVVDAASFDPHRRRTDDHRAAAAVAAARSAGWRASVVGHGDALETRWQELLTSSRASTGAR